MGHRSCARSSECEDSSPAHKLESSPCKFDPSDGNQARIAVPGGQPSRSYVVTPRGPVFPAPGGPFLATVARPGYAQRSIARPSAVPRSRPGQRWAPPPSLRQVAEHVGQTYTNLRHHLPELTRAIARRYRATLIAGPGLGACSAGEPPGNYAGCRPAGAPGELQSTGGELIQARIGSAASPAGSRPRRPAGEHRHSKVRLQGDSAAA